MMNERWDGSLKNDGFNDETYYHLFRDFHYINKDEHNLDNYEAFKTISNFTLSPLLNTLLKRKKCYFDRIKKIGENYQYKYNDQIINFNLISNKINNKILKKELKSINRYGKCHIRSLELARSIKNSKVLTGYVIVRESKFLHSVVEVEKDNQKYIIDWTKNFIMPKNEYFLLTKFYILSEILGEDILKDNVLLENFDFSCKAYTVFRDEIISALEKNIWMFEGYINRKVKK